MKQLIHNCLPRGCAGWVRRAAALSVAILLAGSLLAAWIGLRPYLPVFLLPALALSVLSLVWEIRRETAPEPAWKPILRHLSVSYAVARAQPCGDVFSQFKIYECSPQFPDWFALDPMRTPDLSENGAAAYNRLMRDVLDSGASADFCACDRMGGHYDMQAIRIEPQTVLLLAGHTYAVPPKSDQPQSHVDNELLVLNYSISHEVKAPVRAIDGYARIFLDDYGGALDGEAIQLIGNIRNICKDTIRMINTLLTYTRIDAVACSREVFSLGDMLREVFGELRASYVRHADVRLEITRPLPWVVADPSLMRQAISNILSNALKFTRDQPVGIICAGCDTQQGEIVFYVRDNGAGFDMHFSEKLFKLFERLHSANEFEGSGIGLAIVKKIILMHGGRVWMTGAVGKGATVFFTLGPGRVI